MKHSRFLSSRLTYVTFFTCVLAIGALTACSGGGATGQSVTGGSTAGQPATTNGQALYDPQALPSGPVGASIAYGHDIIADTQKYLPNNITARMSCQACHLNAGTQAHAGSFIGTYAYFPQWNKRSKRVITLQDRLAECFLYSMNGRPPAYSSREMVALVAYIAWLSRGVPTFSSVSFAQSSYIPLPSASPNIPHGAQLYAQKCAICHQANGAGAGVFPPLWGSTSFNNGAGMSHIDRMIGFVYYNMPQNAPGSLTAQDAYDVSAFVLSHARPHFKKTRLIVFPSEPAKYF